MLCLSFFKQYKSTLSYIACIVLINTLFAHVPLVQAYHAEFSPMDWACGALYILRDFAQQEIQHRVTQHQKQCISRAYRHHRAEQDQARIFKRGK